MKKIKNILFMLLIAIVLMSNITSYAGLVVTKETLEDTLNSYSTGERKAATTITNKGSVKLNFSDENQISVSVTDSTITLDDKVFDYTVLEDKIRFSYTADLTPDSDFSLDQQNLYMALLFVSVADLCEINSNTSLYKYYTDYYSVRGFNGTVPADVDKSNPMEYMKFLSATKEFDPINNSIYRIYNQILVDNSKQFKYKSYLEINFNNIQELKSLEASTPLSTEDLENKKTVTTDDIQNENNNSNLSKITIFDILIFVGILVLIVAIVFVIKTGIKRKK